MKLLTLVLVGVGAIVTGVDVAFAPRIHIVVNWWLAALLIGGGIVAVLRPILYHIWDILRMAYRLGYLEYFEKKKSKEASVHRKVRTLADNG